MKKEENKSFWNLTRINPQGQKIYSGQSSKEGDPKLIEIMVSHNSQPEMIEKYGQMFIERY